MSMRNKWRYFWLLSDGKTVKEITWEKYRELINKEISSGLNYKVIVYLGSELYLHHGTNSLNISLNQLENVLKVVKDEKTKS